MWGRSQLSKKKAELGSPAEIGSKRPPPCVDILRGKTLQREISKWGPNPLLSKGEKSSYSPRGAKTGETPQ